MSAAIKQSRLLTLITLASAEVEIALESNSMNIKKVSWRKIKYWLTQIGGLLFDYDVKTTEENKEDVYKIINKVDQLLRQFPNLQKME